MVLGVCWDSEGGTLWSSCRTFAADEEDLMRQRVAPAQKAFPDQTECSGCTIALNICISANGTVKRTSFEDLIRAEYRSVNTGRFVNRRRASQSCKRFMNWYQDARQTAPRWTGLTVMN